MEFSVVLVGCGSIGLPLAAAFASVGVRVHGQDIDAERLQRLAARTEPLTEADLAQAIGSALQRGLLDFSPDGPVGAGPAARGPRCSIIAVPTPWREESGFDRSSLDDAFGAVCATAAPGDMVCIRSTVPAGTTRALAARAAGLGIDVVSAPDRSVEGRSFQEQFEVPHLIGALDPAARERAAGLFGLLGAVTLCATPEEAETAKLLCNVTRDVMFALANEVGRICDGLGVDSYAVRAAAAAGYARFNLARPGPVGGPCLAKDTNLLLASAGAPDSPLIRAARAANFGVARTVAGAISHHLTDHPGHPAALLGTAFKGHPAVADMRGSTVIDIANLLRTDPAITELRAWDPECAASALVAEALSPVADPYAAVAGAVAVVLGTDHAAVAALDFSRIAAACHQQALIFDLCGVTAGCRVALQPGQVLRVLGGGVRAGQQTTVSA